MARRCRLLTLCLASAFVATTMARDARAMGPIDIEAAGTLGAGTDPLGKGGPNPLGLGGGGRAGVAFRGIYAGVALTYYAGESSGTFSYVSQDRLADSPASDHALMVGLEAGYGLRMLGFLTARPQVGLGNFALSYAQPSSSTICGLPCDATLSGKIDNLYLQPGVTVLGSFGLLLVGVDASVLALPNITEPFATSATFRPISARPTSTVSTYANSILPTSAKSLVV